MTATSRDEILRTITAIAVAETGIAETELRPDVDLRGLAGVDSVRVLRMVAKIERAYDIELEDEQVFDMASLDDVVAVVDQALRAAA
ncbi:acyl carrier protein [Nocardia bovistercoris]|uniref:Acyl carrier protein n=1 Tax=Nocardia bovistercoris TaxID=2785916 RepID=A0A931I9H2_9NOCA|nr:acyl carrier protein [Nocardia bovistercoris]MBH0776536.1 acyl carrier protein [Nocardia bovistercoris]